MQLVRTIAHTNWGADCKTILKLYQTLIRSKLDYGCFIYGATRKSYIKELNTIHHQGLRLALGAFPTTPVESLYAEANEPTLEMRRTKLALQYYTKLASNTSSPIYQSVSHRRHQTLFQKKEKAIKPYGLRSQNCYLANPQSFYTQTSTLAFQNCCKPTRTSKTLSYTIRSL